VICQRSMLSRVGAMFASKTGRRTPGKRNPIRCRVRLGAIRSAMSSEIQKHPPYPLTPKKLPATGTLS
jgi:hypothetical protein